ncbi:MAG TPA: DUF2071 domain-containing protein [Candidatus Sulfotelmatobacter sp.]
MPSLLDSVAHRPWALPSGPWVMRQIWHDLLFAHWPLPPAAVRPLVPRELALDIYDGACWIGVVPFRMSGIHRRGIRPLPGVSAFPELNVRTYVTRAGEAGVYFFSLDAANLMAVMAARAFYRLPYFYATMSSVEVDDRIHYACHRYLSSADFRGSYRPISHVRLAEKGSIEHWLTERYCLYTVSRGHVYRGDIHHTPWPLQEAEAELETNTVSAAAGISLPPTPPLLHFARRLEVLIWRLGPVGESRV